MENFLVYNSISEFNAEFGIPTLHPLIHAMDMARVETVKIERPHCFNFYSVYLKDNKCGDIKYGRNYYDYQDGTMLFTAPMQVVNIENPSSEPDKGWVLMFHPDFLNGTQLGRHLKNYSYFQYAVNEALHLSVDERSIILNCFHNLFYELQHVMDGNSKSLLISNLELLLNYSKRFYERQFVTRLQVHTDSLSRFECILDDYLHSEKVRTQGFPTVKYCADKMNLSANYLTDMLRKHTGKSASEHIQIKLVEAAKEKLIYGREKTVNEIAYELGFEYPQYFCRLFKRRVGMTPNEYRNMN